MHSSIHENAEKFNSRVGFTIEKYRNMLDLLRDRFENKRQLSSSKINKIF